MNMPTLAKRMFAVGLAFACGTALAEEAKLAGTTGGSTDGYTRARSVYVAKQAGDESAFIGNVAEVEVWGCRADYARPLMIVVR